MYGKKSDGMLKLSDDVASVRGIGKKKKELLGKLEIATIRDLMDRFPVRYRDWRWNWFSKDLEDGGEYRVAGKLERKRFSAYGGRNGKTPMLECIFRDGYGQYKVWFYNMPFMDKNLRLNKGYVVFGKCRRRGWDDLPIFDNPEICQEGSAKDLERKGYLPVYGCTAGVTTNDFNRWIKYALQVLEYDAEWIPEDVIRKRKLCTEKYKYEQLHFPESLQGYRIARSRYIYENLFLYQLVTQWNRAQLCHEAGDSSVAETDLTPFLEKLPFELTEGQKSAVRDIQQDLSSSRPMNRLVQGDVGCGKTAVAETALYRVAAAGGQCAFMAPTEILARQHHEKLSKDFEPLGIRCVLLISALSAPEKKKVLQEIREGTADVVVGTHAIIQENVIFQNLELVITDEQHRFGVNQRRLLMEKSRIPNVLVMSATPIPRTLQATVYGDMDFSMIRSRPAERKSIITRVVNHRLRSKAYAQVKKEVQGGNRAYIVAPAIDEGEEMVSVTALYREVKNWFSPAVVTVLHGRMDPSEKERVMAEFAEGKIQVLVSTVVIEVGIDVPEATVMVIENADRFGLAQLHQLRGRVGRSNRQSYCWLVNYSDSEGAADRLQIMQETDDGFLISEEDYRLRGPGDVHGTMQHGSMSVLGEFLKYEHILQYAREDVEEMDLLHLDENVRNKMKQYLWDNYENTI